VEFKRISKRIGKLEEFCAACESEIEDRPTHMEVDDIISGKLENIDFGGDGNGRPSSGPNDGKL
jgi:hypothetical protein